MKNIEKYDRKCDAYLDLSANWVHRWTFSCNERAQFFRLFFFSILKSNFAGDVIGRNRTISLGMGGGGVRREENWCAVNVTRHFAHRTHHPQSCSRVQLNNIEKRCRIINVISHLFPRPHLSQSNTLFFGNRKYFVFFLHFCAKRKTSYRSLWTWTHDHLYIGAAAACPPHTLINSRRFWFRNIIRSFDFDFSAKIVWIMFGAFLHFSFDSTRAPVLDAPTTDTFAKAIFGLKTISPRIDCFNINQISR